MLRPVARDTLEHLELSLDRQAPYRPARDPGGDRPSSGDGSLRDFPRLMQVSITGGDGLAWTLRAKQDRSDLGEVRHGRILADLLPETLRTLEIWGFNARLEPDLGRFVHAVGHEGRFTRLRTVRVSVAPLASQTTEKLSDLIPGMPGAAGLIEPEQRAAMAEVCGRAGVEVVFSPFWMWGNRRDESLL